MSKDGSLTQEITGRCRDDSFFLKETVDILAVENVSWG